MVSIRRRDHVELVVQEINRQNGQLYVLNCSILVVMSALAWGDQTTEAYSTTGLTYVLHARNVSVEVSLEKWMS